MEIPYFRRGKGVSKAIKKAGEAPRFFIIGY